MRLRVISRLLQIQRVLVRHGLEDVILAVSTAKLHATQAVVRVTQTVLHTAGGWGLTTELPAMRWALDALVAPVTVGSVEIQQRAIARQRRI